MWSGNLKTAIQSLRQNKLRSMFTMLGVIIGVSSVVTIVSLGEGLKNQIEGQINQLGSNVLTVRPGKLLTDSGNSSNLNLYAFLAPSTLTKKDADSVKALPSVSQVAPIEFVTNSASSDSAQMDNAFVAGATTDVANILQGKVAYGDFYTDDDPNQNTAVIGYDVAKKLFNVLNPVGQTLHIMGQDFVVHGVLQPNSGGLQPIAQSHTDTSIYIPSQTAEQLTAGHSNITQILVQAKPKADIDVVAGEIRQAIAKNHGSSGDFTVLKQDQLLGVSSNVLNTVTRFISGIAAISLLVGGIGIMDIMLVSISERNREIGIRKAIGATNRQIMQQFLTEGLALTITGGVIGIIVSLLINLILRLYTDWQPAISVPVMLVAVGFSVIIGLIFSLAPALKAARKDPITALRGE